MDHLQTGNVPAAKDALSLLMVCLEQTSLDSGRMDVGLMLALTEDPPSSLFTNRSLSAYSRGKAFAPLADQRWVTTALSYIRELDLIATKRADVNQQKPEKPEKEANPGSKKAAKKQSKGGGKRKEEQSQEE